MKWFKCCHCNNILKEEDFYRDKSKPSGRKPRCKSCEKLYIDREKRRIYEANYQKKYPEKRREILRKWYETNKESYMETLSSYRKTDQFKANHRHHGALRRARIKSGIVESIDFLSIYKDHPFCFYCGKSLSLNDVEFDHFVPISRGGNHTTDNIKVSCMTCNRRKGAMTYQVV